MGITRYSPPNAAYDGLRVQLKVGDDTRRQYFSFAGKTPTEKRRIQKEAEALLDKWEQEAQAARRQRMLSRPATKTSEGNRLGLTGLHLHWSTSSHGSLSLGFRVSYKRKIRTFCFGPRRTMPKAWSLAIECYAQMRGLSAKERKLAYEKRPSPHRMRQFRRHVQNETGFKISLAWCEEAEMFVGSP